jgi:WD40 repeat protein
MQWENVPIFISSTFNDMHAERDYLVKSVFPALSEWCEERRLRLIDIDLRWGVTAADSEAKNTVRACLRTIDECRPFFLCFLGQRRGWVPSEDDIGKDTYELFPRLLQGHYVGTTSVTEMEVLHALVDPLHNGILRNTRDDSRSGEAVRHAFFYLRDPGYLEHIPHQGLRAVYTNEAERDQATADRELARWREQEIPQTGRPVHSYQAEWRSGESTPEIALPLCVPTTAPKDSEAWRAAFVGWKARWAAAGVDVGESGEITGTEGADGTEGTQLEKARAYNAALTSGRLGGFQADGLPLADVIIEELKAAIAARYPAHMTVEEQTPLQREIDQQAQFLRLASEGFIERAGDLDALEGYLRGDEDRPFAVTASAGMGKTSLLARLIDSYHAQGDESLHYRFIGASDDSASAERLVRSVLSELEQAGKLESGIPANPADMMDRLPELLAEAGASGRTILVLDALNQLESGMGDLYWIPSALPKGVKLIISFKRGEDDAERYYRRQEESGTMVLHSVRPFESPADRKALVAAYLEQYLKELDEERIQALIGSDGAENPLFLKAALSELRVFGVYNDLSELIRTRFGNTPEQAFCAILERMEKDPAYTELTPAVALPHMLGWMAHSRFGMAVEELADLLVREGLAEDRPAAFDCIYLMLRQLRPFLAKRDGRVDFFYDSFKIAATKRYTGEHRYTRSAQDWHRSLAGYFEALPLSSHRRFSELIFQYDRGNMADELISTVFDYAFIRESTANFGIGALIGELRIIGSPAIDNANIASIRLLEGGLELSRTLIGKYGTQLPSQLWGRFCGVSDPHIARLLDGAVRTEKSAGSVWFRPTLPVLDCPGGNLLRVFEPHDNDTHVFSSTMTDSGKHVFIVRDRNTLERFEAHSGRSTGLIRIDVDGHIGQFPESKLLGGSITELAARPDGRGILVVLSHLLFLRVDADTGRVTGTFLPEGVLEMPQTEKSQRPTVWSPVRFSSDGTKFYYGGGSGTVYEGSWEPFEVTERYRHDEARRMTQALFVCTYGKKLAFSNVRAYTSSPEHYSPTPVVVVDTETGESQQLPCDGQLYVCLTFSEKGDRLTGITEGGRITQWSLVDGVASHRHLDIGGYTRDMRYTPDGRFLITASAAVIQVWDARTHQLVRTLAQHTQTIYKLGLSKDGRLCASTSPEKVCLWDVYASPVHEPVRHDRAVYCIASVDSDRMLLSSSYPDKALDDYVKDPGKPQTGSIGLWDVHTGSMVSRAELPRVMETDHVRIAKDGPTLLGQYEDVWTQQSRRVSGIKEWDVKIARGQLAHIKPGLNRALYASGDPFSNPPVRMDGSGRFAFLNHWADEGPIVVADLMKKKEWRIRIGEGERPCEAIAALPGKYVFALARGGESGLLERWDLKKNKLLGSVSLHSPIRALHLSDDSKRLFCVCDKGLFAVSTKNGEVTHDLSAIREECDSDILHLASARGGELLLALSECERGEDAWFRRGHPWFRLALWSTDPCRHLADLILKAETSNVLLAQDGSRCYFGDHTGQMYFMAVENV